MGTRRSTQELHASSAWRYSHPMSASFQLVLFVISTVPHMVEFSLLTTTFTILG